MHYGVTRVLAFRVASLRGFVRTCFSGHRDGPPLWAKD